ncbi:hypothetical protein FHS85_002904 [Rhodoligotrophos appendicifer]|uniref:hypothetical protein n=1 Tax=Rhodoligotrophos appendicifer TaxID=987056 RepID=UPI00118664F0|nr:hypothetical protein [Rhodoligotrophos appendicifer]
MMEWTRERVDAVLIMARKGFKADDIAKYHFTKVGTIEAICLAANVEVQRVDYLWGKRLSKTRKGAAEADAHKMPAAKKNTQGQSGTAREAPSTKRDGSTIGAQPAARTLLSEEHRERAMPAEAPAAAPKPLCRNAKPPQVPAGTAANFIAFGRGVVVDPSGFDEGLRRLGAALMREAGVGYGGIASALSVDLDMVQVLLTSEARPMKIPEPTTRGAW